MALNEIAYIKFSHVHVSPEHLNEIKAEIEQFDNAEIYENSPEGKIIVVWNQDKVCNEGHRRSNKQH